MGGGSLARKSGLDFRGPKAQAGRETSGQKVPEHQIQLYSWEETREFRTTWAVESDEEVGVGSKELCRIQARGQRQPRKPRATGQVEVQKAGGKEGGLRGVCTKGGNKTWTLRNLKVPGPNWGGGGNLAGERLAKEF